MVHQKSVANLDITAEGLNSLIARRLNSDDVTNKVIINAFVSEDLPLSYNKRVSKFSICSILLIENSEPDYRNVYRPEDAFDDHGIKAMTELVAATGMEVDSIAGRDRREIFMAAVINPVRATSDRTLDPVSLPNMNWSAPSEG